ncbi:hypothetical protein LUX33_19870 [Actinomadura madurae]|uniref:hypothetical protein n=1 Tax=Actinomadura madurae TaxID=1993 RepID=UPI0020D1F69A|nr:hypothetical protein [Actinomadura madurae]MCP9950441.1 hypothetical protein [Actinomadura madurae]
MPSGTIQPCFHPSSRTARSSVPPAVARQPLLKFSFTVRNEVVAASTSSSREPGPQLITLTRRGGRAAAAPGLAPTVTDSTRKESSGTDASRFGPDLSAACLHALNRSGRPASRSPRVPVAFVGTAAAPIRSFGPYPHGSWSG